MDGTYPNLFENLIVRGNPRLGLLNWLSLEVYFDTTTENIFGKIHKKLEVGIGSIFRKSIEFIFNCKTICIRYSM